VRIEDAGFEIRDMIAWVYGSGFPKSLDVSKAIDKAAGAEREKIRVAPRPETSGTMTGSSDTRPWIEKSREVGYHEVDGNTPVTDAAKQWHGWGTALKPALEPITVARKPLGEKTVAENVLAHGTGAINVDGGRVEGKWNGSTRTNSPDTKQVYGDYAKIQTEQHPQGRWPANLIHDGSEEVVGLFPMTGASKATPLNNGDFKSVAKGRDLPHVTYGHDDNGGSAARFFYCAKASKADRGSDNNHPTVKPTDLMRYLCRLVTPPKGIVLDPFMGSGSTGKAAVIEEFNFIGIEREESYMEIAEARINPAKTPA
jgi:site-specific DNA-methyltransferase (adenine-specific)